MKITLEERQGVFGVKVNFKHWLSTKDKDSNKYCQYGCQSPYVERLFGVKVLVHEIMKFPSDAR